MKESTYINHQNQKEHIFKIPKTRPYDIWNCTRSFNMHLGKGENLHIVSKYGGVCFLTELNGQQAPELAAIQAGN